MSELKGNSSMAQKLIILTSLAAVFTLSACSTQRIYMKNDMTGTMPSYEKSQTFFIYGIGQTQDLNAGEVCGKKSISRIETNQTFVDGLLSVITFGIYTPRTVSVFCKKD